jgi:hypothetical protein
MPIVARKAEEAANASGDEEVSGKDYIKYELVTY